MPRKLLKAIPKQRRKGASRDGDIGRRRPNRTLDCARIMVDFLEAMFQKLAQRYCEFPEKMCDSFCGILYYRGARRKIREYMSDLRCTLRYWISHQHLKKFTIVLKDLKSDEELGEITVGFFSGTARNWASAAIRPDVVHELKDRLVTIFEKLDQLPTKAELLEGLGDRELKAQIRCSLLPEVTHPDFVAATEWIPDCDSICAPKEKLLYSTPRINSEFVEFSLQCSAKISETE